MRMDCGGDGKPRCSLGSLGSASWLKAVQVTYSKVDQKWMTTVIYAEAIESKSQEKV